MSKIFKPRRGTTYTMTSTDKKNTVLAKGELFIEVPNTGVGTGASKIKIGDGVTTYENLPEALSGSGKSDVSTSSSTTVTQALNNVVSGKTIPYLFGELKKAVSLQQTAITKLNDELPFSLYISGTSYGYKKTDGTFVAFRGDSTATYTYATNSTGGTVDLGARNNYRYVNAQNVYTKGKNDGVTVHTDTYNATTRSNSTGIDLTASHSYRYIRTDNVPNSNSGTYTFATNDTGGTKDLGTTNTYRYVNATNVYNKGKSDGTVSGYGNIYQGTHSQDAADTSHPSKVTFTGLTTNHIYISYIYSTGYYLIHYGTPTISGGTIISTTTGSRNVTIVVFKATSSTVVLTINRSSTNAPNIMIAKDVFATSNGTVKTGSWGSTDNNFSVSFSSVSTSDRIGVIYLYYTKDDYNTDNFANISISGVSILSFTDIECMIGKNSATILYVKPTSTTITVTGSKNNTMPNVAANYVPLN